MQDSKPPLLGIFSRWLFAIVILAVVGVFFWTPAKEAIKSAMARSYAKESIAAMHADDFGYAITQLRDARSYAPEEPAVLEAIIEYLKLVKGDPREIAYNLRVLSGKRTLTSEEQILYADSLVRSGQAAEARKTFDKLPAADAQSTVG
ncbi:MAG: hypothetical protein IPK32_08995 [Verrucomicrobiaceae bacterium]|nr:hypothetical protein [Verrucomicrobiaceae bacterium]